MLPECPAELSFLAPYLQRASELHDAQQPVMSYYCTLYAVSLALKSPARFKRSPETDVFLATLFTRLEQEKGVLAEHPAIRDVDHAAAFVREFAYRIFLSAERDESSNTDSTGGSDDTGKKRAMQKYLAAVHFLQVYRGLYLEDANSGVGFDEETRQREMQQTEEKSKYAKWRVLEIRKSVGGVSVSPTGSPKSSEAPAAKPATQPTSQPAPYQLPSQTPTLQPGHYASVSHHDSRVSPHSPPTAPVVSPNPRALAESERLARFAISALHFDDVPTAVQNLQSAINVLLPLLNQHQQTGQ